MWGNMSCDGSKIGNPVSKPLYMTVNHNQYSPRVAVQELVYQV